jgi:preprotein translocase subunit SecF
MELYSHKTKIDFMGLRKKAMFFSVILFAFSVITLMINGLNYGQDFTGGMQIEVSYSEAADISKIRHELEQSGFSDAQVQTYGSAKDVLVKLKLQKQMTQQELTSKVMGTLSNAKMQRAEYIGPQVGQELVTKGVLAVIVALLGTMIYIALRFQYRFAISAAISLIHDPMLILGLFSFFHIEFDLVALAAVLTVIGFSLNDTIVVYDRVRENFRKIRKATSEEILNLSVNQTLSRTTMTSGLTFCVILALFIFGGQMLRGFSLAMMIGIVIGTYSSIYIAGALAIAFGLNKSHLMPAEKKQFDSMP